MTTTINASTSSGLVNTADTSGILQLQTAGTAAVTVDASQNVGIGTASPTAGFRIQAVNAGGSNVIASTSSDASGATVYMQANSSTAGVFGTLGSHPQTFVTNNTERMRIDSSGFVGIGYTSPSSVSPLTVGKAATNANVGQISAVGQVAGDVASAGMSVSKFDNNSTTSQIFFKFLINGFGAGSGQINANGASACAFGTYSDVRLKENIEPLPPQLDNILALKPSEFDYIEAEGGGHQIGFIAQEMQEVYPDVVGERNDGMLTVSGWDKTTARLVKAIQEQQTIITELKSRIEALEGAK